MTRLDPPQPSSARAFSPRFVEHHELSSMRSDEFPAGAAVWPADLSRRRFLQLMGASLLLGAVNGCNRPPKEEIVPYTVPPEAGFGADALYYASAFSFEGFARGVLVTSTSGRPIKIEGNPAHPESSGATDTFTQASILELYDPDRSRAVLHRQEPTPAEAFNDAWLQRRRFFEENGGAGLALLTEPTTSPSLLREIHGLLDHFPQARWYQHTPLVRYDRGGRQLDYDFERADVIFALEADPLFFHPAALRYSRAFATRRRVRQGQVRANRLYVAEGGLSITGSMADLRLPSSPTRWPTLLNAVTTTIEGGILPPGLSTSEQNFIQSLARDLRAAGAKALCVVGPQLPESIQIWAEQLNTRLGSYGTTVRQRPAARSDGDARSAGSLPKLVSEMENGKLNTLFLIEANPVYTAPADLEFARRLAKVPHTVHFGLHRDETAAGCEWHVPASHYLEAWSDLRAYDGTVSIVQPLIEPLHGTVSTVEFIHRLVDPASRSGYELVRETWSRQGPVDTFDARWRGWLDAGVIDGSAFPAVPDLPSTSSAIARLPEANETPALTVLLRPDASVLDGRWANNAWLQELPRPFTHLAWDNALLIAPALAQAHGLTNGDVVLLRGETRSIEVPICIVPGQPEKTASLFLGYGRTSGGSVAQGCGFNAYPLRTSASPWSFAVVDLRKTGRRYDLVSTREHHSMEGRDLVRVLEASQVADHRPEVAERPSLYPEDQYKSYAWAMSIDLSTCIGCNACVVACQAENNIPVVGKEQARRGREMHWLRVDRYYEGDAANPRLLHQPVPCMHCEKAPCELVCPVGATVHSAEGLNDMVYNRCVGTRYCSNNCPYKVRRFNFLDYTPPEGSPVYLQSNPSVTIRARGVMEKCTYCVQRINAGRIRAEKENRRVRDGEVKTACQQVCPVEAIVFGDKNDPHSAVAQLKRETTDYALLAELNTQPRTTYLMRVVNRGTAPEKGAQA